MQSLACFVRLGSDVSNLAVLATSCLVQILCLDLGILDLPFFRWFGFARSPGCDTATEDFEGRQKLAEMALSPA